MCVICWAVLALLITTALSDHSLNSPNRYVRPPPRWKLETTFQWKKSSDKLMQERFSQSELCTLEENSALTLDLRQHCQSELIQRSGLKTRLKNPSLSDPIAKSIFLKNLPQCDLGFIKSGFSVETSRRQIPQCIVRGTPDRPGYRFSWAGIPQEFHDVSIDLARYLTKPTAKTGKHSPVVTNLVFLGDSVSTQLAQFLICDLARAGVHPASSDSTDLLVKAFTPSVAEFHLAASSLSSLLDSTHRVLDELSPSSQAHLNSHHSNSMAAHGETIDILRIHNVQFNLPCIHYFPQGCDTLESTKELTVSYLTSLIENYTRLSSPESYERTVIVLNYGLHIRPKHSQWAIPAMVKAYLRIAMKYHNRPNAEGVPQAVFLFRETSSQVFTSNNHGHYEWDKANTSVHPSEYCCNFPLDDPHEVEWRNEAVMSEFARQDPSWRDLIGWVPFFNDSLALYDLRVEFHRVKHIDCTHFIYSPTAYSSLWYSIKLAAQRLYEKVKTSL